MVRVNPDLPNENAQFNPVNCVTGLFDGHDAVTLAVGDLEQAGFARADIDVFAGAEGERLLDPSGETRGTAGRWFRVVERLVSDTSEFHALALATLNAGGFVLAVKADDDDARKAEAMAVLGRRGARDVKYWNSLFVEQGPDDAAAR